MKCFACDKEIPTEKAKLVITIDGQEVYVGPECFKRVTKAGKSGYRPESWDFGGELRLYLAGNRKGIT